MLVWTQAAYELPAEGVVLCVPGRSDRQLCAAVESTVQKPVAFGPDPDSATDWAESFTSCASISLSV